MPSITINGQVIQFPDSGTDPNWAEAVIQFAEATEGALNVSVGPFDVPPQVQVIDSSNPGTSVAINNLSFSTANVRAAFIKYSVYRTTSTDTAYEAGELITIYNANGSSTNKWEIARQYVGDGKITFTISDTGNVTFSTTALAGISHVGRLSYSATTLIQT